MLVPEQSPPLPLLCKNIIPSFLKICQHKTGNPLLPKTSSPLDTKHKVNFKITYILKFLRTMEHCTALLRIQLVINRIHAPFKLYQQVNSVTVFRKFNLSKKWIWITAGKFSHNNLSISWFWVKIMYTLKTWISYFCLYFSTTVMAKRGFYHVQIFVHENWIKGNHNATGVPFWKT